MTLLNIFLTLLNILLPLLTFAFVLRSLYICGQKKYRNIPLLILWIGCLICLFPLWIFALASLIPFVVYLIYSFSLDSYNAVYPALNIGGNRVVLNPSLVILINIISAFIIFLSLRYAERAPYKRFVPSRKHGKLKEPFWIKLLRDVFNGMTFLVIIMVILKLWTRTALDAFDIKLILWYIKILPVGLILFKSYRLYKRQKDENDYLGKNFEVLYLRSFYLDNLFFANVKISDKEFGDLIFYNNGFKRKYKLTFDRFFGHQIKTQIGDFIGIGQPAVRAPSEGLQKLFPAEETWPSLATSLIAHAKIIFMQVADTPNLMFELNHIIKTGRIDVLYVFTPPVGMILKRTSIYARVKVWVKGGELIKMPDGVDVKRVMDNAGIQIDFVPPLGSVIGFSRDKRALLLKSHCTLPSEYIGVVKNNISR